MFRAFFSAAAGVPVVARAYAHARHKPC